MKQPTDVIKRLLVTEKMTLERELHNRYAFEVAKPATKIEIRRAVEALFQVKVESVHTLNMPGRVKRIGRNQARVPSFKKAIVTLAKGSKIDVGEVKA